MQTQAVFHLMPDGSSEQARLHFACSLAANYFRQQQKVYIFTEDQQLAHHIDELLWSFEPDSFVPHNLVGEGPKQGAPVEIGWQPPRGRRAVLINLAQNMPVFANQFSHVMDFVPAPEQEKQLARERFKACRQLGFQVDTHAVST